ncbi:unnamed protein product [Dibothriocephalus latus]|uniref:Fucosyltransferase n=1 Tax=Dibothriocephalus latus TaxID=60516 RepID=A0A3P7LCG8_DIBLA|nr:unnamed protein product [Dibothriocephalus latus]
MTTNAESDVPWIYAVFMANEQPEVVIPEHEQIRMLNANNTRWLPEQHAQRKKGVVAALISNMNPSNKRMEYIAELAKYIKVDLYGRGRRPCSREGDSCLRNLARQYKFYLAFENAHCQYYMTEKLFKNALLFGMVPVVLGAPREDYCRLAPPNAFMHVEDFSSPAKLASYLHWLDRNNTAYASYFAWKAYGKVVVRCFVLYRLTFSCREIRLE